MRIIETSQDGVAVAAMAGRLDAVTAPVAEPTLLELAAAQDLVLDLAAVGFMSSAGLRVLLKAAKAAKAGGRRFSICGMQPPVAEVFAIGGFDRILKAYAGRDEAVKALRRSAA